MIAITEPQSEPHLEKHAFCERCNLHLRVEIPLRYLDNVSDNGLFNYVVLHATDHALVLAIDKQGGIRRSRIAAIDLSIHHNHSEVETSSAILASESTDATDPKISQIIETEFEVIEEASSLADAFGKWLGS